MASSSHCYSSLRDHDVSDSFPMTEGDKQEMNTSPMTRCPNSSGPRLLTFVSVIVVIASLVSFLLALAQFLCFQKTGLPTTSSKDVDPYFSFRYSTDFASQDDYRDGSNQWKTQSGDWLSCGHTPHQAIERGCKFDIMSAVWLPQPCYNETFAKEVAAMHHTNATSLDISPKRAVSMTNFTWHSDESLSPDSYIPLEDLEKFFIEKFDRGESLIAYSIENFHVAHCLYMFRAALRGMERVAAGEKHVYVHEEAMGRPHANHCQNVLMNYEKWKHGVVALEFGMGWCKRVS